MSNPTKSNSNNALVIGVVAAIVVAGVVVVMMMNQPERTTNNQGASKPSSESSSEKSSSASVKEGSVSVEIKDFDFNPATITVKKGTKVTWTNKDDAHHDITPDDENPNFKGSGKLLAQGEDYSFTFNEVGTYKYNCSPHPYMKATIEVVE